MISMRLRRLYFLLSHLTGFPRDFRPGMQGLMPFRFQGVPEPVGVIPAISQHPLCCPKTVQQDSSTGIIADLSRSHEKTQQLSALIGDRMQLRIRATSGAADQATLIPSFSRRPEAVGCALRYVASIMMVWGSAFPAARPSIIRTKIPHGAPRFQRL